MEKIGYIRPDQHRYLGNSHVWGNVYKYPIMSRQGTFSGMYGKVFQYGEIERPEKNLNYEIFQINQ